MIMRWLFRLAFPALGLLLVLIFFGINDSDVSSPSDGTSADAVIPSFEGEVPPPLPDEGPEIVFKWRDTEGNWHYADRPPDQGTWNALAIEPAPGKDGPFARRAEDDDWTSPYSAPFHLDTPDSRNDS
ncbi:DUF4124 domain-containing protein [Marinobacter sp.]|uniref:DUF4124 domain-containing protein n=1 Tax=Marinobacter sp. TaxID=50741 RepID=UPI00384AE518